MLQDNWSIRVFSHPKTDPSSTSLPNALARGSGFGQTDALADLLRQRAVDDLHHMKGTATMTNGSSRARFSG